MTDCWGKGDKNRCVERVCAAQKELKKQTEKEGGMVDKKGVKEIQIERQRKRSISHSESSFLCLSSSCAMPPGTVCTFTHTHTHGQAALDQYFSPAHVHLHI